MLGLQHQMNCETEKINLIINPKHEDVGMECRVLAEVKNKKKNSKYIQQIKSMEEKEANDKGKLCLYTY